MGGNERTDGHAVVGYPVETLPDEQRRSGSRPQRTMDTFAGVLSRSWLLGTVTLRNTTTGASSWSANRGNVAELQCDRGR